MCDRVCVHRHLLCVLLCVVKYLCLYVCDVCVAKGGVGITCVWEALWENWDVWMYMCVCVCVCVNVCTCLLVCRCLHVCMCSCVYSLAYIADCYPASMLYADIIQLPAKQ